MLVMLSMLSRGALVFRSGSLSDRVGSGSRESFSGTMRNACDGWISCTWLQGRVRTGPAHREHEALTYNTLGRG